MSDPQHQGRKRKIFILTAVILIPIIALSSLYLSPLNISLVPTTTTTTTGGHQSYTVQHKEFLNEYNAECITYRHIKTGAEVLSIQWLSSQKISEDNEKTFGIFFRTPPHDSTGVPHIIEHSVLCGSRKYTTKEPFSNLLRGSLNTFLNAFTWPDRTGYAFSSCNTQDFYNSLDVYLDAVFYPRAVEDKFVLAQEGWHLEPVENMGVGDSSVPDERRLDGNKTVRDTEFRLSGVVYSEMKGAYSSIDEIVASTCQKTLFPNNTYAFDSGGDPSIIPSLTFEKFKAFYRQYYHPSNARVFVAGLDKGGDSDFLAKVDTYLRDFNLDMEKGTGSEITWQKKFFKEPKKVDQPFASTEEGSKGHVVVLSWLLNDEHLSPMQELALLVLDHLLIGTSSSVLKKNLLESGLGSQTAGYGVESELLQSTFSIGLKGVKKNDTDAVETLILETLTQVANQGFTENELAASMNTIEFNLREFSSGDPKGISFMFSVMSKWIYDYQPTSGLRFEHALNELKTSINQTKSAVFQGLLNDLFLNNKHRLTLNLYPSATFESEQLQEERNRIEKIKSGLNDDELQSVIDFAAELKRRQATPDTPEQVATIPTITIQDIDPNSREYPIAVQRNAYASGITMVTHSLQSTNGILYTDFGLDISGLTLPVVEKYLPLFTAMLTRTGTTDMSDVYLSQWIGMHTGGVGVSLLINAVNSQGKDTIVLNDSNFVTKMMIQGKATADKSEKLLDITKLILMESNLNSRDKAIEILKQSIESFESDISENGHRYALYRLRSRYSVAGILQEKMNGITAFATRKALLKEVQENWGSVHTQLESIRSAILDADRCRSGMVINLTGDDKVLQTVEPFVQSFVAGLPGKANGTAVDYRSTEHPWVTKARAELNAKTRGGEALIVTTQVNYVAKGNKVFHKGEKVSGSTSVVTSHLSKGYLWDNVRVEGGAYGAFAVLDPLTGFNGYVSYRDPHIARTLDAFDAAADKLLEEASRLKMDSNSLELAIISQIGDIDGSPPPSQEKGWISFLRWLTGESAEARQLWRQEVLGTTPVHFENFANRLKHSGESSVAVVCSQSAYEEAVKEGKVMDAVII